MKQWAKTGLLIASLMFLGTGCWFLANTMLTSSEQTDDDDDFSLDNDEVFALFEDGESTDDSDPSGSDPSDGDSSGSGVSQDGDETADDEEDAQVPPGLDPRAFVVSIEPYVTDDGTHGFIVGFKQAWDDGLPVLYSFFEELIAAFDGGSMTAGVQTHDGFETAWGPGQKSMLDDGRLAFETGFPYSPDNDFNITVNSGSQATSDSPAVFNTYMQSGVSTANATTIDPSRFVVVLDEGPPANVAECSIVNIDDNGGGIYVVMFQGDCEAASEGYYSLSVFVTVNSQDFAPSDDMGISVRCGFRVVEQVPLTTTCSVDDREDGQSDLEQSRSEVEWTRPGELTIKEMATMVTNGNMSATVTIVVTEDGLKYRQDFDG